MMVKTLRHFAEGMIIFDLPSPAEAGFAKAGNRRIPFRVMPDVMIWRHGELE